MKTIIIPDVHGKDFWKKAREIHAKEPCRIVFLGDYFDSYWGFSRQQEIENFKEIVKFASSDPENITLLIGNHDFAYMFNQGCSRQAVGRDFCVIASVLWQSIEYLALTCNIEITLEDGTKQIVLCSHAGVTTPWIKLIKEYSGSEKSELEITKEIAEGKFNKLLDKSRENPGIAHELINYLWQVGPYRGGWSVGSMLWADVNEWPRGDKSGNEYLEELGYYGQFIGHTRAGKLRIGKDVYCFDDLENEIEVITD